jgi:hypothetical protein
MRIAHVQDIIGSESLDKLADPSSSKGDVSINVTAPSFGNVITGTGYSSGR